VHGDRLMTRLDWLARFLVLPLAVWLQIIFGIGEEPLGTQGSRECLENVAFMAPTLVTDARKKGLLQEEKRPIREANETDINICCQTLHGQILCVDKKRETYNFEKKLTLKKKQNYEWETCLFAHNPFERKKKESASLGTFHNGGSGTSPAHRLRVTVPYALHLFRLIYPLSGFGFSVN
jgi:hypothetical protein